MQRTATRQTGLTLLELVVSLLVMTILTSVAITSVSGIQEQARYEKTRQRLEEIRRAILGDPSRTVNGQPMISGFVADMGRLPRNLHELLEKDFCSDRRYPDQTSCAANGGTWLTQGAWQVDSATGLGYGWRGPYLVINDNPTTDEAFTDGWGNADPLKTSHNYGWLYHINSLALTLQSLGRDGVTGGVEEYDQDFPANQPFIARHDWTVDIPAGIQINLNKYSTGGINKDICLRIHYRDPNAGTATLISDASGNVTVNDVTLPTSLTFSPMDQHDIDNDGDTTENLPYVPAGILAIGVYEYDIATNTCTTTLFPTTKHLQFVSFVPGIQPIINW